MSNLPSNDTIIWISHRGYSHNCDENTLQSFENSVSAGFSWLETDLRATGDNHIVLNHDGNIDRISGQSGDVEAMTRAELEQVTLNHGGKILFLDEFMQKFSQQKWVFDMKASSAIRTIALLKPILQSDSKLLEKIIFLFWEPEHQKEFSKLFPKAQCFARKSECYWSGIMSILGLYKLAGFEKGKIYSITPKLLGRPVLNRKVVKAINKYGAKVLGYLPDDEEELQMCKDAGVQYILTNYLIS